MTASVLALVIALSPNERRVVDEPLVCEDSLTVEIAAAKTTFDGAYLRGDVDTLVLPDAKLADYGFGGAGLRCRADWGGGTDIVTNVPPMFVTRTDSSLVAQFQYYAGDVWPRVRCAKVELSETDGGLVARIVYVRYVDDWISPADGAAGVDFDTTEHKVLVPNTATSDEAAGIGVKTLTLVPLASGPAALVLTGQADFGSGLAIGDGVTVELQGEAARSPLPPLSGSGDLVLGPYVGTLEAELTARVGVSVQTNWTTLVTGPDCSLAALTGLREVMRSASGPEGEVWFFENDGSLATCQIQSVLGDYNRCCFLELKQEGLSVLGRVTAAYLGYLGEGEGKAPVGTDFRTATSGFDTQDLAWAVNPGNPNGEGVSAFTLVFSNVMTTARFTMPDHSGYSGTLTLRPGFTLFADADHPVPDLVLDGGALTVSGDVLAGTLALADDSELRLAEGSSVSFAVSAAEPWAAGKVLSVVGSYLDGVSIRFGADRTALLRAQARSIGLNNSGGRLRDDGWVERSCGLAVIVR